MFTPTMISRGRGTQRGGRLLHPGRGAGQRGLHTRSRARDELALLYCFSAYECAFVVCILFIVYLLYLFAAPETSRAPRMTNVRHSSQHCMRCTSVARHIAFVELSEPKFRAQKVASNPFEER